MSEEQHALKLHQEMYERRRRGIAWAKGRDLRQMLNDANRISINALRLDKRPVVDEHIENNKVHS